VSDLEGSFAQLLGRQPTDQERQNLYKVRDALKLGNSDSLWLLLMVLGHYETLYSKFPALILAAAKEVTKTTRETALAQAQAAAAETTAALGRAVQEAAVASARQAAGARQWRWISIGVAVVCLSLVALSWVGFRRGRETGFANGWAMARQQCDTAAAAASWANTPEGKLAYRLAEGGNIRELANCSGRGWVVRDGVCWPQAERGKMTGWRLAPAR